MGIGIFGGSDGPTSVFVSASIKRELVLFLIIVSILLIHEMDAIRAMEWRMFVFLRDMAEETAYRVFAAVHFPLYFMVLYIIIFGGARAVYVTKFVIDIFLLAHAILHYCFRKKETNGFCSWYSKVIIYSMAVLALIHLFLLF